MLAVTIRLLAFLFIDAVHEGFEGRRGWPGVQGTALFIGAAATAYLGLEVTGQWLRQARGDGAAAPSEGRCWPCSSPSASDYNFGEGLAIGAAFALGQAALGTLLIVGFTLHNTTEGGDPGADREGRRLWLLVKLGLIGGVPTIAGAWLGGFVYSRVAAVFCLGLGAGAIAQVIYQLSKQVGSPSTAVRTGGSPAAERFATAPVMLGLLAGFTVMYATGMLVG